MFMFMFMWGVNWPTMKLSLQETTPLMLRASTLLLGAGWLFFYVARKRRTRVASRARVGRAMGGATDGKRGRRGRRGTIVPCLTMHHTPHLPPDCT